MSQGYNLIHWSRSGMTQGAVSDLNYFELFPLRKDCDDEFSAEDYRTRVTYGAEAESRR